MKPKLSFIGDLTLDVYPKLNSAYLGGSSLTCALWAKKLGAEPTILAAVGDDFSSLSLRGDPLSGSTWQSLSNSYIRFCQKNSINTDFIKILPGKTSSIEIFLDKNGDRTWGNWDPGVLAKYHLGKTEYDFLKTQNAVALPVYYKTRHLLKEIITLKSSNPLIVVDFDDLSQFPPSPRLRGASKSIKIIEDHLPYIDIVIVGLDMVSDAKIIRKLQDLASTRSDLQKSLIEGQTFNKLFVVTLNKNGSLAFLGDKVFRQKADKIQVVNSTGAGDAFLAGFLVEYVKSKNVQKSLLQGTKTATQAISKPNAF